MDLNALKIFVTVSQVGSLSAAAERLSIPLPTVSRRMLELERQLRVQLFERSRRGTKLTDAGARLYESASRGIELLDEAEQMVRDDQAALKGRLRLSLPPGFEPWWDLLSRFRSIFPDILVQVHATERRVDLIEDGIDVALRIGSINHDSMIARPLFTYHHVLVASPVYLEHWGTPQHPDELAGLPCGAWSAFGHMPGQWRLGASNFSCDWALVTNDYWHLRSSALRGDIITELPPFLAAQALGEGRLVKLMPDHLLPPQEVHLLYPSHRHPSAIVRAYLDFCEAQASQLADACSAG